MKDNLQNIQEEQSIFIYKNDKILYVINKPKTLKFYKLIKVFRSQDYNEYGI